MDPRDIGDLVHTAQATLCERQLDRIEYVWWDTVVFPFPKLEDAPVADSVLVADVEWAGYTPLQLHRLWRAEFFVGGPPDAEAKYRNEDAVVEKILGWLKKLGPRVHAYKVWGGGVYAHPGAHDITGGVDGRRFEIEVKHKNKPMTAHQAFECRRWRLAGVTAFYTNSLEGAQRGLADLLLESGMA